MNSRGKTITLSNMRTDVIVDTFSQGYFILHNVDVVRHSGSGAIIPLDMELRLREYVTKPLLKLDSTYYWPQGEHGVPADTVAIPEDHDVDGDGNILLTKDPKARELVKQQHVARP